MYWYFGRGLIVSAGYLIVPPLRPAITRFVTAATFALRLYFGQRSIVASAGFWRSWKLAPTKSLPCAYLLSSCETARVLFSTSVPTMLGYDVQSGIVSLNIGGFFPDSLPAAYAPAIPASRNGKITSAPSAISAAVACLAFATSLKSPVMLDRTLIFGLISCAPCLKPAAACVVGGIS